MELIAISVITGILTAILGFIFSLLSKRREEEEKHFKASTKDLAETISARAELAKAKNVEAITEKLSNNTDPNDFMKAISGLSGQNLIGQLHTNKKIRDDENQEEWFAVEKLVDGYHRQALDQARIQFWFSVVAASVGFAWIIYTGSLIDAEKLSSSLKTFPGIVIETVAFLFFKQAEATRKRATALYDRLRSDKHQSQAISLVNSIDDIKLRSAVKAQLSLHMSGLSLEPINLSTFLNEKENSS